MYCQSILVNGVILIWEGKAAASWASILCVLQLQAQSHRYASNLLCSAPVSRCVNPCHKVEQDEPSLPGITSPEFVLFVLLFLTGARPCAAVRGRAQSPNRVTEILDESDQPVETEQLHMATLVPKSRFQTHGTQMAHRLRLTSGQDFVPSSLFP